MRLLKSLKSMLQSLYNSVKCFPVTISLSTLTTVMVIMAIEAAKIKTGNLSEVYIRLGMATALGIPISLLFKFVFERLEKRSLVAKVSSYILGGAFLVLYYLFWLPDFEMVSITRYLGVTLAFYLLALAAPYCFQRVNFEIYITRLITRFIITLVFAGVLQMGLYAILLTLNGLLGVAIYPNLYLYIWITILGVFAPVHFLGGVPSSDLDRKDFPEVLKVLLLYIIMPLLAIYTLILYIYFAKIIITLQWPVGLVGHLVLWYAVISTITIFLITPLESDNKWVKTFIFWFTKVMLPLLVMMFFSLGKRIEAYGITENRFYVLILGLWVLGTMLYWNFSRRRNNISLPLSLAILALVSVCGPLSSYAISIKSQTNRFYNIVTRYDMLSDQKLKTPKTEISDADKKEINEIIKYFQSNHTLKDLKYLPEDFGVAQMPEFFGFEYQRYGGIDGKQYFLYVAQNPTGPLGIKDYDYLFDFYTFNKPKILADDQIKAEYDPEKKELKIEYQGELVYQKSFWEYLNHIYENHKSSLTSQTLENKEMEIIDENDRVKVKILFTKLNGYTDSQKEINFTAEEFYLLVKLK